MNVVLHYRASDGFRRQIDAVRGPDIDVIIVDEADDDAFRAAMRDAEVLLHVLRPVRAEDIAGAPRLKLIQKIGVGVNTIDLEAAKARGIAVCNMPGSNSRAVAEMALMLMLAALRRTNVFDPATRQGRGWRPDLAELDKTGEIGGRTVGLVGYGAVAARLAAVLRALGATVIYTARTPRQDAAGDFVVLDELLTRSDIVSLHVPLTPETRGLIGRAAIGRMKSGAIIVNTARGDLVDEAALVGALRSGHIAAAGLDVFAREPADSANPLFSFPSVIAMPHIAWLTPETLMRSLAIAMENCRRVARGEALLHRVI
jgi:phosphoglycerate dehydrogenase-like enzyme